MSRVSKFLENELDRVNEYLGMAMTSLTIPTELCEERCRRITTELDVSDEKIIDYLDDNLSKIEAKIGGARDIIYQFKDFCFNLENKG